MGATVAAPVEWVESVSDLRLPPRADARVQQLTDRNTEGLLTEAGFCLYLSIQRKKLVEANGYLAHQLQIDRLEDWWRSWR
jgi:hypothetical protein